MNFLSGRLPSIDGRVIKKTLFCLVVITIFLRMFVFSWDMPWREKYQLFFVPAFSYPGGDSRNIQVQAFCEGLESLLQSRDECIRLAKPVKDHFPDAVVPAMNYPSHWVKIYSFLGGDDYSERIFRVFWSVNALLLVFAILIYCFRYNYFALPVFLFSPITLLAVERGNTDAATFFVVFVPLLFFASSGFIQGLFLGVASSLKIYPVFGYVAFIRRRWGVVDKGVVLGFLVAAPLMIVSALEIPRILAGTSGGFAFAYGLTTLMQAPIVGNYPVVVCVLIFVFLSTVVGSIFLQVKREDFRRFISYDFGMLGKNDINILFVSVSIYFFSFLLFANWSYRLIFLIPAFLALTKCESLVSRLVRANIIFIFVIPFFPYGWHLQNLACFPLTLFFSWLFGGMLLARRSHAH